MDAKKMLVGILTTAIGWSVGLMVYNKFLVAAPMVQAAPAEDEGGAEEGE
jgi:hypothetical protein